MSAAATDPNIEILNLFIARIDQLENIMHGTQHISVGVPSVFKGIFFIYRKPAREEARISLTTVRRLAVEMKQTLDYDLSEVFDRIDSVLRSEVVGAKEPEELIQERKTNAS